MVNVKLASLAKKLNKSISDIARETKINRNTITALYHNKVNGIRFDTLHKICKVYKVSIDEILDLDQKEQSANEESYLVYKQEGAAVPFTGWPWVTAVRSLETAYFDIHYDRLDVYFIKDYAYGYWHKSAMDRLAKDVYKKYSVPDQFKKFYSSFCGKADALEAVYRSIDEDEVISYDNNQLVEFFQEVRQHYKEFWAHGLFIDAFDAGFDQQEIKQIAKQYDLTIDEVATLTTPADMTYNNEREYRVLKIVKKILDEGIPKTGLEKFLLNYVQKSSEVKEYILDFDYYKSNYAVIEHIAYAEIVKELKILLKNEKLLNDQYKRLHNYSKNQKEKIVDVLKKHKLKENPLFFFNKLTYWREYRKQINLMGIHVLHRILASLEDKTGIAKKYLACLSFDEVKHVLRGLVSQAALKRRAEKGVLVAINNKGYKMVEGEEAASLKNELEKKLVSADSESVIVGHTACQGYAKGEAKIILSTDDFDNINEGDILVTGMTRPEFVPVMKKAAAIVTNEGGITCHAAIVSRELGKPCIIGTQNATQLIKNGDLVEVRANHGTVRILNKA